MTSLEASGVGLVKPHFDKELEQFTLCGRTVACNRQMGKEASLLLLKAELLNTIFGFCLILFYRNIAMEHIQNVSEHF